MSYIKHKERVFLKKERNAVKKRSDCNLRRISSCGDVRAWSTSADHQRQYFLDCITSKNTSFGKYVPPDVIVDILKKQNTFHRKKLSLLKKCSSEDLMKKKNSLKRKKSRINIDPVDIVPGKLITNECNYEKGDDGEINNLRVMVKDLESKLLSMKKVENENMKLKTQIQHGIKKIESVDEIGPLVTAQFVGFPPNQGYEYLSDAIDIIRNQCSKMRSNVQYLQTNNVKLSNKLKRSCSLERKLKNDHLCMSLETVNNAILKSKVSSKNFKIQKLQSLNEEQKINIESLLSHIKEMTIHFSWKEEMLIGRMLELKNLVKSGYKKTSLYENHLAMCRNLIQEMETLRNHFRIVNGALKQEVNCYKNRLKTVASKVLDMASKIEFLLDEVAKRDAKINELSRFPGRTSMAVRLSQLDNILNGDFIFDKNKNGVVETFERLKSVLKDLKREAWDSYGIEHPLSFSEKGNQIILEYCDFSLQTDHMTSHIEIQTIFPDEYVVQFALYTIFINIFNTIIRRMKLYLKKEELANRDLTEKLDDQSHTLRLKEVEIEELNNRNQSLLEHVDSLNSQIEICNLKANSVQKESVIFFDSYESLNVLFYCTLLIVVQEYGDYCNILEGIILKNEETLDELRCIVESELDEQRWQYFCYCSELEKKNDLLQESLSKERTINLMLNNEIDNIMVDLDERDKYILQIQSFWLKAECEKDEVVELLSTRALSTGSQIAIQVTETDLMTNSDLSHVSKSTVDKLVQANLDISYKESTLHRRNLRNKWNDDKTLRKKLSQVNVKLKRIRMRIVCLRTKLELSVDSLKKLKESNLLLAESNKNFIMENGKLKNKNGKLRDIITHLQSDIKCELSKNGELQTNQINFFNDFTRIQSDLLKLKDSTNKILSEASINTDMNMTDFETILYSKEECISQLKSRIEKLLVLLKEIEQEKKNKEDCFVSRFTQCDVSTEKEFYQSLISNIKKSYENEINNLKKDFTEEMDTKEKYQRSNLNLLKDTYERDIKRIKVANAESLRKIQTFHEDEIRALKKSQVDSKIKAEELDSNYIHEKHGLEMEQLKMHYESLVKEKAEMFLKEKEQLQNEIKKYMTEKESQVEEITKKMEEGIKNMKKKCKQHMKKLQKESFSTVQELRKQYGICKVDDTSSIDTIDMYSLSQDKEYSIVESEDTRCIKDESDTFVEASDTSGFDEESLESVVVDERRVLLSRIEQLELQLSEKRMHTSENACDSEKRVWIEKERCRETRKLLDKEIERNDKLRCMLKEEKNRGDKLALINQALLEKLHLMELTNQEKDVERYRVFSLGKEHLPSQDYVELYDCFDANNKSDYTNCY